jgi:5-methylthioadenosine/S-adenosylhomocysteine deaminase
VAGKVLLKGGCVLTLGSRTPNFAQGDLLVENGRVAEVGPGLRIRDAELVDASDTIVMPGFVDCHRHVWRSLLRNLGGDVFSPPVHSWAEAYQPDDLYAATLIGLLGAAEAGITTVVDWSDLREDARYTEAALQAHFDAGLRSVFVPAPAKDESLGLPALPNDSVALPPLMTIAGNGDGSSTDEIALRWGRARELGMRIHAHARPSDAGLLTRLAGADLLGEDVTLAHCSRLTGPELDAIASTRTAVALTPASEMAGGMGSPPIQELIDRNVRPGLGIADERVSPGDMFAQMRTLISLQHATSFDLKLAGKGGVPQLLTTREVIRHATIDGARVAGLAGVTGALEPGSQADIIVLRTDRPNISPVNDPIGAVVWGMDTSNLAWVFVGGRALMRDGVLEADVERARNLAVTAQRRVGAAAGLMVESTQGETP